MDAFHVGRAPSHGKLTTAANAQCVYSVKTNSLTGPITCTSSSSSNTSETKRRSNLPPELRAQSRRLKKQNMERKRRACISDKMNALYCLVMGTIGADPESHLHQSRLEKADMLNVCYNVFEGIARIIQDRPDLQARLRQLRSSLQEPTAEAQRGIPFASVSTPDISKINSPKVDAIWNKENQTNLSNECRAIGCSLASRSVRQSGIHTSTPLTNIQCQKEQRRSNIDDSGLGGFTGQSFGIGRHDIPHKPLPPSPFLCPSNSPLHIHKQHSSTSANTKYFLNQQTPIFYSSNSAFTPVRQKPTRVEAVWRPYLD